MTRVLVAATVPEHLRAFHLPIVAHFRSKGWSVDGMSRDISGCATCTAAFDRVWDVDFSRNPLHGVNLFKAPRTIRQVVYEREFDLIHVHTPVAAFVVRYALRNMSDTSRPAIIYTAHGFHFHSRGNFMLNAIYRTLEKVAGKWTDFLVVMNKEDYYAAMDHGIVDNNRVTYMPGIGLDTDYYSRNVVPDDKVNQIKQELGIQPDGSLFLMIAEFIPRKRHEDLLKAFALMRADNSHLVFAGHGRLENRIRGLAQKLNIAERVHFLGFRTDIPVLLKASTAVILPSLHEGLPRCFMEALCLEVPCVGSDIRGTRDLLNGGRGLLVEVGDIQGLCSAMKWILANPKQVAEMVERGKSRMAEFDVDNIIGMHEKLYQQALGGGP